jgi:hypothetical protein
MSVEEASNLILYELTKPDLPDVGNMEVGDEVNDLMKHTFHKVNFDQEKEIASRLTELHLRREKTFDPSPIPLVQDNHASLYSSPPSSKESTVIKGTPITSNTSGVPIATAVAATATPAYGSSREADVVESSDAVSASQRGKVDRMMTETKQSKEICNGYLEMLHWDYDAAVYLYNDCTR